MTSSLLAACVCLCVSLLNLHGTQGEIYKQREQKGCGCLYNVYANMPLAEREKRACSVDCVYYTLSGQCNNRCHPEWGQSMRPFGRLLKPDYCTYDAPDATRCAKDGSALPNARLLSRAFFQNRPVGILDKFITSAHMAFGQFLSHDFGRKNEPKPTNMQGENLCGKNQCTKNAVCTPMEIFRGDPDFPTSQCLRFQRSTRNDSPDHECKEQQNDVSSYLDLNTVYGGTNDEMILLRDARREYRAYLNMTSFSQLNLPGRAGKPLLPQKPKGTCRGQTATVKCFLAGDKRVKEQPQLTVFHTLLSREHNRLVEGLNQANGGCWTQERLFQEARKINIAVWQVIVYNEYLPLLLSEANLRHWRLKLADYGYTYYYDKTLNATVSNVFMTASFRFGHTQIPEEVPLGRPDFSIYAKPVFSEVFNNPTLIYFPRSNQVTGIDAVSFGMIGFSAEATDGSFNKQITRSFDAEVKNTPARDLESLDIQRGRDHALPGYNAWLKWCGLQTARNFNEFIYLPTQVREKMGDFYRHVDDVDLFVAGMLEIPLPGDLSGPVFSCLNADQFHRARFGDRFFYGEKPNGFTREQLQNIRQMTSGKLFCDNLDDVKDMQPNVLAHPKSVAQSLYGTQSPWDFDLVYNQKLRSDNERVPCSQLPGIDFSLWKETGCWNANCDYGYPKN